MRVVALLPVLSLLGALAACAAPPPRVPQDEALARALRGAWCNSDDGGRTCWAYDHFRDDGTLRACGRHPDEPAGFDGVGVVRIDGTRLCYRVTAATPNFWVRPGTRFCTRIVAVGADWHRYQDPESGALTTLTRVPVDQVRCPVEARP